MTTSTLKLSAGCLFALLPGLLASCASVDDAAPDGTERIEVALTAIPAATRCVRFTTVAGGRTFAEDFDVTGLGNLSAQVRGLPANVALSISADAYAVACTAITPTTQATWVSAPVAVTLTPGVVPAVSFVLRPAGGVSGDVDFLFLAASPASRAFPAVAVGQTSAFTFTVTNIGPAATGVLAASLAGTGANQFVIGANTCAKALPIAGTCTIVVTFTPTAAGAKAATLQLVGAPGGTLPIALTGTGVQAAVLALSPLAQSFGTVGVGKSSPPVTYTVTNSGGPTTAAVDVTSSDPTFAISGSTCGVVLSQAQTCTFKVTFSPTAIAAKSTTLIATAATVTTTTTATGNGVAAPALTLTPNTIAFGTVLVGETRQMPFTIKNVSGFTLDTLSVFVGGMGSAPFTVDARACTNPPGTLPPGASCMGFVNVTAIDQGSSTVPSTATLLINAGGANPASVMGTTSITVSWPLVPSQTSINFGAIPVGTTTSTNLRFTNISPGGLGPFVFSTSKPTVFTIASSSCGNFGIAAGFYCDLVVRFTAPATAGMSVDGIQVTGVPGSSVSVALRGVATAP